MRKIISILIFISFILGIACAQDASVDPNQWDFGKVKAGEVLSHEFVLRNMSPKTLNITGINTSCGCTASQSDKKSLKPGEGTLIRVSFDSRGYSGKVSQFVYVNTDNPDLPIERFVIKAEIFKEGE